MGAPVGNTNNTDGRLWRQAIRRALEKRSQSSKVEAMDALAEKLLAKCDEGDMAALKEFGDRIDGKPSQAVTVANPEGQEFVTKVVREIVRAKDSDA